MYDIAPGESKHPVSFMTDKQCKELAFPSLFPKGRFGFTAQRDIKLTPVKYFNARLLHYSGGFSTNPEYLFFAQFIIEQNKVSDNINIAMKKIHGQPLTASSIRSDREREFAKSNFQRSSLFVYERNSRLSILLAEIYV